MIPIVVDTVAQRSTDMDYPYTYDVRHLVRARY